MENKEKLLQVIRQHNSQLVFTDKAEMENETQALYKIMNAFIVNMKFHTSYDIEFNSEEMCFEINPPAELIENISNKIRIDNLEMDIIEHLYRHHIANEIDKPEGTISYSDKKNALAQSNFLNQENAYHDIKNSAIHILKEFVINQYEERNEELNELEKFVSHDFLDNDILAIINDTIEELDKKVKQELKQDIDIDVNERVLLLFDHLTNDDFHKLFYKLSNETLQPEINPETLAKEIWNNETMVTITDMSYNHADYWQVMLHDATESEPASWTLYKSLLLLNTIDENGVNADKYDEFLKKLPNTHPFKTLPSHNALEKHSLTLQKFLLNDPDQGNHGIVRLLYQAGLTIDVMSDIQKYQEWRATGHNADFMNDLTTEIPSPTEDEYVDVHYFAKMNIGNTLMMNVSRTLLLSSALSNSEEFKPNQEVTLNTPHLAVFEYECDYPELQTFQVPYQVHLPLHHLYAENVYSEKLSSMRGSIPDYFECGLPNDEKLQSFNPFGSFDEDVAQQMQLNINIVDTPQNPFQNLINEYTNEQIAYDVAPNQRHLGYVQIRTNLTLNGY